MHTQYYEYQSSNPDPGGSVQSNKIDFCVKTMVLKILKDLINKYGRNNCIYLP